MHRSPRQSSAERSQRITPTPVEQREKEPDIEVMFYFSEHSSVTDFQNIRELLQRHKVDVYIPEVIGADDRVMQLFEQVSTGSMPKKWNSDRPRNITEAQLEYLYGKQLCIVFLDVPAGHPLLQELQLLRRHNQMAIRSFSAGDLQAAMDFQYTALLHQAEFNTQREEALVRGLKQDIPQLKRYFPELENKKPIRVLMSLGAAHTNVHHQFKKASRDLGAHTGQTYAVGRHMSRGQLVYTLRQEMVRSLIMNRGKQYTVEQVARMCTEDFLGTYIIGHGITDDSLKSSWLIRTIQDRLSIDMIASACQYLGEYPTNVAPELFVEQLRRFGVVLPANEAELDALLGIDEQWGKDDLGK